MVGEQSGEWLDASIARVLGHVLPWKSSFQLHPQVEEAPTVATVAYIYMHMCIYIYVYVYVYA